MPEVDGFSSTSMIRDFEKSENLIPIPICALTANAGDDIKRQCLNSGFNDYITKPFTRNDLCDAMQTFIQPGS